MPKITFTHFIKLNEPKQIYSQSTTELKCIKTIEFELAIEEIWISVLTLRNVPLLMGNRALTWSNIEWCERCSSDVSIYRFWLLFNWYTFLRQSTLFLQIFPLILNTWVSKAELFVLKLIQVRFIKISFTWKI